MQSGGKYYDSVSSFKLLLLTRSIIITSLVSRIFYLYREGRSPKYMTQLINYLVTKLSTSALLIRHVILGMFCIRNKRGFNYKLPHTVSIANFSFLDC